MPQLKAFLEKTGAQQVHLDQCAYNLRIPDNDGNMQLAKKGTIFAGTLPGLEMMFRRCSGDHQHVHVIGGVRTKEGWVRRSTLAGAYPPLLCKKYVNVCLRLFN